MNRAAPGIGVRQACIRIPRLTPEQWRASSPAVRWLIASRAPVLVMTFASAATGGALAWWRADVDVMAWGLCAIGLMLAHAANNQLNDWTDSRLGIDRGDYFRTQYGAHVLEDRFMSGRGLLATFAATAAVALAIGIVLVFRVGPGVGWLLGAGALLLLFYTFPLKRLGLGEIAVWLAWGPLMTAGSAFVAAHAWHASFAWVGAVAGLAPTAVVFGKHIDKSAFDAARGIRTLPVRLGAERARSAVVAMLVAPYPCIAALIACDALPWSAALVLLAVPDTVRAVRAFRQPPPRERPAAYRRDVWPLWYSAHAFAHARSTGVALLVGTALAFVTDM